MDVLITVAPKDFNKLKYNYESIIQNVDRIDEFVYISPIPIPAKYLPRKDVFTWTDTQECDFDIYRINMTHRHGWYRQQFIKLFQESTSDNYLVVDADAFICAPLRVNEEHPIFYLGNDQLHQPYFNLMKDVVNLDRVYPHSFISEIMYFEKDIIIDMLVRLGIDSYTFFDRCVEHINKANDASGFSEYELYGNYVTKYFPTLYQYEHISVLSRALKREWTDNELKQYIKQNKDKGYDILTMHSWL